MDGAVKYILRHPVTKRVRPAGGAEREEVISELTLRRPDVAALCATDRVSTDAARNLTMLEKLSGLSASDIDRIDLDDVDGALTAIAGMTPNLPGDDDDEVVKFAMPAHSVVDGKYHVPLAWPIAHGDDDVAEIVLRRPNGGDMRACDEVKGEMKRAREMLVRISDLTRAQINTIDGSDFLSLMVLIGNFTQRGRPTGATR